MDSQAGGREAAADDFDALDTDVMFDRYRATLTRYGIDPTTAGVVTFSLFGGTGREIEGRRIRGEIHAAPIIGADNDTAGLLSYLTRVVPSGRQVNGTGASFSGLFGNTRTDLTPGVLLEAETNNLFVLKGDSLKKKILDAFEQVLSTGEYTFTKSSVRETVETDTSVLFFEQPTYEVWTDKEPVPKQIPLPRGISQTVDFLVFDSQPRGDPESLDADALPVETARDYLSAARELTPTLSEAGKDQLSEQYADLTELIAGREAYHTPSERGVSLETLARASDAVARTRHSETVTPEDVDCAAAVYRRVLDRLYKPPEGFDTDKIEVLPIEDYSHRQRIQNLKQLIAEIEEDYEAGAPVDVVMARASEIGMEQSKVEHEIDKLKQKGEAYEPSTNHLRTT